MATLMLRLAGPMQSWGTTSRFTERDTGKEPSKSGVLGLLAAALGIDRGNWLDLEPLTQLSMGVRHDRPGLLRRDYQTAGAAISDAIMKADGSLERKAGVTSRRYFLADAAFLVALQGDNTDLLARAESALRNPVWPLFLGRKSYVPSEPIWLQDGLSESPLSDCLTQHPWVSRKRKPWEECPARLLLSLESGGQGGVLKMDQPLAAFSERRFGARFVRSEWIPFPGEVEHHVSD